MNFINEFCTRTLQIVFSFLFAAYFLLPIVTLAQQSSEQQKEANHKWSFAAAINSVEAQMDQKLFDTWVYSNANYYGYYGDKKDKSYSFSIIPKYRVSKDFLLRFEFGITKINLNSYYNGSGDTLTQGQGHIGGTGDFIKNEKITQRIYRYCLGVQRNILKVNFIEAYCGASLNYFNYTKMDWRDYIEEGASSFQLPEYKHRIYTATTPGGFAAGIGALAGMNVYLNKWISLGGELSYSLLYYKLGGVQSGVLDTYQYSSSQYFYSHLGWSIHNNASEGIQFSKVMPSFNISIRF